MRFFSSDRAADPRDADDALELTHGMPPPGRRIDPTYPPEPAFDYERYAARVPTARRRNIMRWAMRGVAALIVLFVFAVGWLAITAPLSKSLQPPTPPSITLLADDGRPFARRGAVIDAPVDAAKLPKTVTNAFLAIEDRRFRSHWGIDPRGIARAFWHNLTSKGRDQGGSTITQQLAKNAFLDSDRTAARKIREVMIAFWLEAWLTKDQILSRYLSNVYFGDNVYGLRAAARHYFARRPENLSIGQAAMLAGLVKAPSKLAPTTNLQGARGIGCASLAGRVAVRWHSRLLSTAGLARPENAEVHLNPRLTEFPGEVERTLRHELAHLAAYDRAGRRRITAHGAEWRLACMDLGIPDETRCHTLPLARRQTARRGHVYRCPACAATLRRTRPINVRQRRLACRECCRRHAAGQFDRRFEFVKVEG